MSTKKMRAGVRRAGRKDSPTAATARAKRKAANAVRRGRAAVPRVFPTQLAATPEDWRALKRTQWREVMQALARYNWGSAYCPAGNALHHLHNLATQVEEALEPNDWIAW